MGETTRFTASSTRDQVRAGSSRHAMVARSTPILSIVSHPDSPGSWKAEVSPVIPAQNLLRRAATGALDLRQRKFAILRTPTGATLPKSRGSMGVAVDTVEHILRQA